MNIGKKLREYEVKPAVIPVPQREKFNEPAVAPETVPSEEPVKVPAGDE